MRRVLSCLALSLFEVFPAGTGGTTCLVKSDGTGDFHTIQVAIEAVADGCHTIDERLWAKN
jgi:hypothetical protein